MKQLKKCRETVSLPISAIVPNPDQPRRVFDEDELGVLQLSIKERGMMDPINVIKSPRYGKDGKYMIVSGERRWRAMKALEEKEIECIVMSSRIEADEWALIENIVRVDLDDLEKAEAMRSLLKKKKNNRRRTQKEISKLLGKDDNGEFVSTHILLLQLPDEMKEDLRAKDISRSVALSILRGHKTLDGVKTADPVKVMSYYGDLYSLADGKQNLTGQIVDRYFLQKGAEKKHRAPRKAVTNAAIVRKRNGVTPERDHSLVPARQSVSPLRPALIAQMEACLNELNKLLGPEVKVPKFPKLWNELSRGDKKDLLELSAAIQHRLARLDDLTKAKSNGKAARA